MTKVKEQNWPQLDFLINNFYEIIEFKRGRGIYGDRVALKRPREVEEIFGDTKATIDYIYLEANPVKESATFLKMRIQHIVQHVVNPGAMNILCEFDNGATDWALATKKAFSEVKIENETIYQQLNDILEERYKQLGGKFLSKLYKHKEKQYFLAKSMGLVPDDYANEQTSNLR